MQQFLRFLFKRVWVYAWSAAKLAWRSSRHETVIVVMTWEALTARPTALQLHAFASKIGEAFDQLDTAEKIEEQKS